MRSQAGKQIRQPAQDPFQALLQAAYGVAFLINQLFGKSREPLK